MFEAGYPAVPKRTYYYRCDMLQKNQVQSNLLNSLKGIIPN
jgi:hypothetical protein